MMVCADQDTGTSCMSAAAMNAPPEAAITLALTPSSSMQLVHFAPTMDMRRDTAPRMMETITLHCICPVLWNTQLIHRPSQYTCAVTMLEPMKAETLHMGRAQLTTHSTQPSTERITPTSSSPKDTMLLVNPLFSPPGWLGEGEQVLVFVEFGGVDLKSGELLFLHGPSFLSKMILCTCSSEFSPI
ncbi:hypothetical protein EYF80_041496 [Liparis tanakae]|uniref:Uncharacterized protein n=1 Tax=Liparis tanakae TaxID=230148 RepID=A0A4Z2G3Y5_9TELE|nr:hypothetical protein EYF80_041496 [Liparis tanakae]